MAIREVKLPELGEQIETVTVIGILVSEDASQVLAYLHEDEIDNMEVGGAARFYPDALEIPPFDLTVTAVDTANLAKLQSFTTSHCVFPGAGVRWL